MFEYLTTPRKLTTLDGDLRQPFDPTNSAMFKRYESGYSILLMMSMPNMLYKLTSTEVGTVTGINYRALYSDLIWSYVRIIEREYKRLDGLENITSQSIEFTGLNEVTVNSINVVEENHNPTITLTYTEPYGTVLTRVHELFLKGIDDPIIGHRKHYNGLIDDKILAPSFKNEVFSFLYMITDNTGLRLERAYYIFNAQPTTSHIGDLYNSARGEFEQKELSYEFRCNVLANKSVYKEANKILAAITGYTYNAASDTVVKTSRPLFEMNSNDYADYRGLNDEDQSIGGLNFPRAGKDTTYISALRKYWSGDYRDESRGEFGRAISVNTGSNQPGYNMPIINDGDNKRTDTSVNKAMTIDSPIFNVGDKVVLPAGSSLYNCYGHKSSPSVKKTTGSGYTICSVTGVLSRTEALLYAEQHGTSVVYGRGTKLKPYQLNISGQYYYVGGAQTIYLYVDANTYYDPVTGRTINVNNATSPAPPKPTTGTIKVGSKVRLKKGSKDYDGRWLYDFVYERDHIVSELVRDRAVINYDGYVIAAVKLSDLIWVSG